MSVLKIFNRNHYPAKDEIVRLTKSETQLELLNVTPYNERNFPGATIIRKPQDLGSRYLNKYESELLV